MRSLLSYPNFGHFCRGQVKISSRLSLGLWPVLRKHCLRINPLISSLRQHTKQLFLTKKLRAYRLSLTSPTGKSYHQRNFFHQWHLIPFNHWFVHSVNMHCDSTGEGPRQIHRGTRQRLYPQRTYTLLWNKSWSNENLGNKAFPEKSFPKFFMNSQSRDCLITILSSFKFE